MSEHTFVFADLVGFTVLTAALGDAAAAELAVGFWSAVSDLAADHDAEPVKLIGDAVMVRGRCAAGCVLLGLRIRDELSRDGGYPPVRVGMNTGPAVARGGDWFGTTVNLASRVSRSAAVDEVLVTEHTRRQSGTLVGVELHDRGTRALRNVAAPVAVFAAARVEALIAA